MGTADISSVPSLKGSRRNVFQALIWVCCLLPVILVEPQNPNLVEEEEALVEQQGGVSGSHRSEGAQTPVNQANARQNSLSPILLKPQNALNGTIIRKNPNLRWMFWSQQAHTGYRRNSLQIIGPRFYRVDKLFCDGMFSVYLHCVQMRDVFAYTCLNIYIYM